MKINQKSGVVDIWDIPKLRINLEPSFCIEMMKKLKQLSSYSKIAKFINEPIDKNGLAYTIINFKTRKSGPVDLVYKIGIFLSNKGFKKFHPQNIENHIIGISVYGMEKSTIKNPKLPFDFTSLSGSIFISAVLHDGGISKNFVSYYWNTDINLRKKVFNAAQNIFGVLPSKFNPDSEGLKFPRVCGLILVCGLGMKAGNKIFTDPHIPSFIFNLPHKNIATFLRQSFDDDGTVVTSSYKVGINLSIEDNNQPPKLIIQIRRLLQILGIESTKPVLVREYIAKNDGIMRSTWAINLLGRDNLRIFKAKVNFSLHYKIQKLQKILTEIKEEHFKWHKVGKNILIVMKNLENKYGYFNRSLVAKEINRAWSRMQQIFPKLLKENKIIQLTRGSGTRSAKFKLR